MYIRWDNFFLRDDLGSETDGDGANSGDAGAPTCGLRGCRWRGSGVYTRCVVGTHELPFLLVGTVGSHVSPLLWQVREWRTLLPRKRNSNSPVQEAREEAG